MSMSLALPKPVAALVLAVLSAACATASPPPPDLHTFAGHYTRSDEGSWFRPCAGGEDSRTWVTLVSGAVAQADALAGEGLLGASPTFVRWRAERVTDGRVGPGGPALLVREILEARPPGADDCSPG